MKYTLILSFFAGILSALITKEGCFESQAAFAKFCIVMAPFGIIGQALDSLNKRIK